MAAQIKRIHIGYLYLTNIYVFIHIYSYIALTKRAFKFNFVQKDFYYNGISIFVNFISKSKLYKDHFQFNKQKYEF